MTGSKTLRLLAAAVAALAPANLCLCTFTPAPMRGDHLDTLNGKLLVERVAVVGLSPSDRAGIGAARRLGRVPIRVSCVCICALQCIHIVHATSFTAHGGFHYGVRQNLCKFQGQRLADTGFSLVEVTLALGILAFAVIPMLGLVASGLGTVRATVNAEVATEIVQQVKARLNRSTDSVLAALATQGKQTLYFDNEGLLVDSSSKGKSVYSATVTAPVHPNTGVLANNDLPVGDDGISRKDAASQIYQLKVTTSYAPGGIATAASVATTMILISPID